MSEDAELLRRYATEKDNAAFAELVRRHVDLVHSAAVRLVGGDAHLAWDVTQGVFLALARSASALASRPTVVSWLYTTTRFTAAKIVRARQRARARELEDHSMRETTHEPDWQTVRPVLDEAMHELDERDREAVLLRHFEGRSFAEIGKLCGGLSENAVRMRVERALDKLRARLARRGITSTALALSGVLSAQAVTAAPSGLATAAGALGAASAASSGMGWAIFMGATKTKLAVAGAVIALGIGGVAIFQQQNATRERHAADLTARHQSTLTALREENDALRNELAKAGKRGKQATAPGAGESQASAGSLDGPTLRTLVRLQREGIIRSAATMVDVEGRMGENWATVLGLDPAERKQLDAVLSKARTQLGFLELANSQAELLPDGRLSITVRPFTEGAAVHDEIVTTFRSVLGAERYEVFLGFAMKDLEDRFTQLGLGTRVITIHHDPSQTGKRGAYQMISRTNRPDGSVNMSVANDDQLHRNIASALGPLKAHVPSGF